MSTEITESAEKLMMKIKTDLASLLGFRKMVHLIKEKGEPELYKEACKIVDNKEREFNAIVGCFEEFLKDIKSGLSEISDIPDTGDNRYLEMTQLDAAKDAVRRRQNAGMPTQTKDIFDELVKGGYPFRSSDKDGMIRSLSVLFSKHRKTVFGRDSSGNLFLRGSHE